MSSVELDVMAWRGFVTASIALVVLMLLRVWLTVRELRADIKVAHRLLMVWAERWGQPHELVQQALRNAIKPPPKRMWPR